VSPVDGCLQVASRRVYGFFMNCDFCRAGAVNPVTGVHVGIIYTNFELLFLKSQQDFKKAKPGASISCRRYLHFVCFARL
jgi:hypothetical protein